MVEKKPFFEYIKIYFTDRVYKTPRQEKSCDLHLASEIVNMIMGHRNASLNLSPEPCLKSAMICYF